MNVRATVLGALAALAVIAGVGTNDARAELQGEMDRMFGSMVNVSPPTVWETQRRGGISGGSLNLRNRVVNDQLVSLVPPSFEAGCGGIDFFMGSFSFISKEQFVNLMRAIAANASGYAFNLALGAICEKCQQVMETLQKKIQELNQHLGNSCQLGKGLAIDVASAVQGKQVQEGGLISMVEGSAQGIFDSFTKTDNKNPIDKANAVAPQRVDEEVKGNLMWRALKKAGSNSWFARGDDRLDEVIMNVTGTIIVGDDKKDKSNKGNSLEVKRIEGKRVPLRTLVKGGGINIYTCDTKDENGCKNPSKAPVDLQIKGFEVMLRDAMLGDGSSVGIIAKHRAGSGELSNLEKSVLAQTEIGGLLLRLNAHSEHAARTFADQAAPHIAVHYAMSILDGLVRAAETASATAENAHAKELLQMIGEARTNMMAEYAEFQREIGSYPQLFQSYAAILSAIPKPAYGNYSISIRKE
jgi:conjugative transfer pilus assembly protein TraH